MNTILMFLKSLVSPVRMARYRFMTVFVSILIFVLSSSVLSFPVSQAYQREKGEWVETENVMLLQFLTNMPASDGTDANVNLVFDEIKSKQYKVEPMPNRAYDLISPFVPELENGEREYNQAYEMYYTKDKGLPTERIVQITVIVDLFDKIKDRSLAAADKVKFDVEQFKEERYQATDDTDQVMIVLFTDSLHYHVNAKVLDEDTGEYEDYEYLNNLKIFWSERITFSTEALGPNAATAGLALSKIVIEGYMNWLNTWNQVATFMLAIIYPLIIVLLFWLLFKRSGRLKTFKEYYNIAAISSIIPIAFMFILLWFVPTLSQYYIFIFAAYYLFMLMKINNQPELV